MSISVRTLISLLFGVVAGCASSNTVGPDATPGDVFRQFVRSREAYCRTAPKDPRDTSCRFLEVKPWSPNKDEASRFAHSLKIPNPVPADSGYRPGMNPDEYFKLLCSKEAGEFIFKTVRDVEGIFELRPRERFGTHTEQHLYEPEDPYGYYLDGNQETPEFRYVGPGRYVYVERPIEPSRISSDQLKYFDASYAMFPSADARVQRFSGYSGTDRRSMKRQFDSKRWARFGYVWRGLSRPHDREMGVAGGELIVLELTSNEVLGVRRNYMQTRGLSWLGARSCPQVVELNPLTQQSEAQANVTFISKVLIPKTAGKN